MSLLNFILGLSLIAIAVIWFLSEYKKQLNFNKPKLKRFIDWNIVVSDINIFFGQVLLFIIGIFLIVKEFLV